METPTGQLAAIADLASALDAHGIDYWLSGGWAVDFWVGAVTRGHDDVDLAARRSDAGAIEKALTDVGFEHLPDDHDPAGTRYRLGNVLVEITFVLPGGDGAVLIDFDPPLQWSPEPFGSQRRELAGVCCQVLPFAVVKAGKTGFVPGVGRPYDPKDRADLEALLRVDSSGT